MNNWKNIVGIDLGKLDQNRKSLHQAVQIVGAFPRALLPHDPTDGTASLVWSSRHTSLESLPVISEDGNMVVRVGLSLDSFELYVHLGDSISTSFSLAGKSTNDGMEWLKVKLAAIDMPSEKLSLSFPYQIEKYDFSKPLEVEISALAEHAALYENTYHILTEVIQKWENAFDIRCWPHHFDLATLIPLETDEKDEILKSIGIGLSPGDEGINEPYLYVNIWPQIGYEELRKHKLNSGYWNKEGWSGGVLKYSELIATSDQRRTFEDFVSEIVQTLIVANG